jgi:micrococcal nuclease
LDAGKYVGQKKTVEGIIVRTHKSSKAIFLDFHDPWQGYFYAVIFKDDWGNFAFDPAEYYKGKEVRVTGVIKMYQGSPEIIVESPSQIEVAYKGFNYP